MDILDIALNEFEDLIQNMDKDELKSIVESIDSMEDSSYSYSQYFADLKNEFSDFYDSINTGLLNIQSFVDVNCLGQQSDTIKYKTDFKFNSNDFKIVSSESNKVSNVSYAGEMNYSKAA